MQSVALIGGYFIGQDIRLSTRLIANEVLGILEVLNPDYCLCTGDSHAGILLTKLARMAGIPYIIMEPPTRFMVGEGKPPISNNHKKLLKSLKKDAYEVRTKVLPSKNRREYYLARNKWMIDSTDSSIILVHPSYKSPDRIEGVGSRTVVHAIVNGFKKPHFIGIMSKDKSKAIAVRRWEGT